MKHFFRSIVVVGMLSLAFAGSVSAQTNEVAEPTVTSAVGSSDCTLNGEPIPCDELAAKAKSAVGYGLGFLAVVGVVLLVSFIFWLMMIIHAASHPIPNKAVWIIVQIVLGVIGSLAYYFMVKRSFVAAPAPASSAPGQMK